MLFDQHVFGSHAEAAEVESKTGYKTFDLTNDDDEGFHLDRLFELDNSQVGSHKTGVQPHAESYEQRYTDTSDPNDPKQVHVAGETKSIVQPNAASHYSSKTETAIGQNSFKRSSSTSSSSSSSSFSSSVSSSEIGPNGHYVRTYQTFRNPLTPLILVPKIPEEPSPETIKSALPKAARRQQHSGIENIKVSNNVPHRFANNMPPLSLSTRRKLRKRIGFAQRRLKQRPY